MGLLPAHPLLPSRDAGEIARAPTRCSAAETSKPRLRRWKSGAAFAATASSADSADSESGSIRSARIIGQARPADPYWQTHAIRWLQGHRWRCAAQPSRPTRGLCDDRRRTFCTASEGRVCLPSAIEAASRGVRRREGTGRKSARAVVEMRRVIEREDIPGPTPVRARCVACEFRNYCADIW